MAELLSDLHHKCVASFQALLAALDEPKREVGDEMSQRQVDSEFDKYRLWAKSVGAKHSGKMSEYSLDHRLRKAPFYRDRISSFLRSLDEQTSRARDIVLGIALPIEDIEESTEINEFGSDSGKEQADEELDDSPWSEDDDTSHEENENSVVGSLLKHSHQELARISSMIQFLVSCLYKMPLRQPTAIERLSDNVWETISYYQHFDVLYVRDLFPGMDPSSAASLGRLISLRRALILDRDARDERLGALDDFGPDTKRPTDKRTITESNPRIEEKPKTVSVSQPGSQHDTLPSKATTFVQAQQKQGFLYPPSIAYSEVSRPSSYARDELQVPAIPPIPKDENGKVVDPFICPYCSNVQKYTSEARWKNHVWGDLRPYACTFSGCQEQGRLFANRTEWWKHETRVHRFVWHCNDLTHQDYLEPKIFLEHMQHEHNMQLSVPQLHELATMFQRPSKDLSGQCNLCLRNSEDLRSHVSRHLQRMALFALPRHGSQDTGTLQAKDAGSKNPDHEEDFESETSTYNIEDLTDRLRQNASQHADGMEFWSEKQIRDTIRPGHVKAILADSQPHGQDIEAMVHEVVAKYMKVLAVLCLIDKHKCVVEFVENDVNDDSLPLVRLGRLSDRLARASDRSQELSCFATWRPHSQDYFFTMQYRVNPPFLSLEEDGMTVRHCVFDRQTVMPFLEEEHIAGGVYGDVIKVKIQSDCHSFNDVLQSIVINDSFVVKRVQLSREPASPEEVAFRREVEALKRLSGFVHDHFVPLLMTWDLDGRHCLLFPVADADLDQYWRDTPFPSIGRNNDDAKIRWVAKQIVGMASAIDTTHNIRYTHGDIKPKNIHWYRSSDDENGILVIAGHGNTAFNSTQSRSNVTSEGILMGSGYRPPESDIVGGAISRSCDIWTFGCLLLEMCCWALGGQHFREEFKERRTTTHINGVFTDIFFEIRADVSGEGHVYAVKPQVNQWIAHLHFMPQCTQFFHDLLDLIENRMIIPVTPDKQRIRSNELSLELAKIHQKVFDGKEYYQKSCPEKRKPRPPQWVPVSLHSRTRRMSATASNELESTSMDL